MTAEADAPPSAVVRKMRHHIQRGQELVDDALVVSETLAADLEAMERLLGELIAALRIFVGCAYPVATEINKRGHNWSEAYLDEALPIARALLARIEGKARDE